MVVRELLTQWGFKIDEKKLQKLDKSVDQLKNRTDKIGQGLKDFGTSASVFLTLPILGIGAASVKAASDAEETLSKFDTVFSEVGDQAERVANRLANSYGVSSTKSKQLLSDTGDLLTGFQFAGDVALDLSRQVNELAVDLASFTNFSGGAEGASKALTKALLGERESIKSLGIAILEEDVKARVKQMKAAGQLIDMTERQEKALATLAIAQEQSANAIGDFARTSGSFANQLRIMKARTGELAVSVGQILLPIALEAVQTFTKIVQSLNRMNPMILKATLLITGLAAVVGPAALAMGLLVKGYGLVAAAATVAAKSVLALKLTAVALPAAVIAGILIMAAVVEDVFGFFTGKVSVVGTLLDKLGQHMPRLAGMIRSLLGLVKELFLLWWEGFTFVVNTLMEIGRLIGFVVEGILDLVGALGSLLGFGDAFAFKGIGDAIDSASSLVKTLRKGVDTDLGASMFATDRTQLSQAPFPALATGNVSDVKNSRVSNRYDVRIEQPINVPEGTSERGVGHFVAVGVRDAMNSMFRDAQNATRSEEEF